MEVGCFLMIGKDFVKVFMFFCVRSLIMGLLLWVYKVLMVCVIVLMLFVVVRLVGSVIVRLILYIIVLGRILGFDFVVF